MENGFTLFCPKPGRLVAEDAIPFAEDGFFLVADGLGGSGGFAHPSIKEEATKAETFFETVFHDVFDDCMSEEDKNKIKEYVLKSFEGYFALSDEEKHDRSCIYKSGYFASRIVAALMYAFLLQARDGASEGEEAPAMTLEAVGKRYQEKLKNALLKVSENANLIYDTEKTGYILLPTTLVSVLYKEYEDRVEALYLWAGDSRGLCWDKNGLMQVSCDHETDGIINNMINLSGKFTISARQVCVKKPCVLFAISDGCYSCMTSPLDFEKYFFEQLAESDSYDEARDKLNQLYAKFSSDDTSTVAFKSFGYESFDKLKQDVLARLDALKSYEEQLPGIFSENYERKRSDAKKKITKKVKEAEIFTDETIENYICEKLDVYSQIEAKKAKAEKNISSLSAELCYIVRENYWFMAYAFDAASVGGQYYDSDALAKNMKKIVAYEKARQAFSESVENLEREFDLRAESLKKMLSDIKSGKAEQIDGDELKDGCAFLYDLADSISDICRNNDGNLKMRAKLGHIIKKSSHKYASQNPEYIYAICDGLMTKEVDISLFSGLDCIFQIEEVMKKIKCEQSVLSGEAIDEETRKKIAEYWDKNYIDVLCQVCMKCEKTHITAILGDELAEAVYEYVGVLSDIEKRDGLYAIYNKRYYSLHEVNEDV